MTSQPCAIGSPSGPSRPILFLTTGMVENGKGSTPMEHYGRYLVAQQKLADLYAEASRARLAKDLTVAEGRGVTITGGIVIGK